MVVIGIFAFIELCSGVDWTSDFHMQAQVFTKRGLFEPVLAAEICVSLVFLEDCCHQARVGQVSS